MSSVLNIAAKQPNTSPPSANELTVSGQLKPVDAKRLAKATRSATVGPTTVYYAGLTAPIISASMSLMARSAFEQTGLSNYWVFLLSALCAVSAGISWYLIFMRWAYRHQKSRTNETEAPTSVTIKPDGITLEREHVSTHILWKGIKEIKSTRSGVIIVPEGASAIYVAKRWFNGLDLTKEQFERLIAKYTEA